MLRGSSTKIMTHLCKPLFSCEGRGLGDRRRWGNDYCFDRRYDGRRRRSRHLEYRPRLQLFVALLPLIRLGSIRVSLRNSALEKLSQGAILEYEVGVRLRLGQCWSFLK